MRLVTAAVIVSEGKVLLARRRPGDSLAGYWEFPGGVVEPGETLAECLGRELIEELGLTTVIGEVIARSQYVDEGGALTLVALRATIVEGELTPIVHDKVEWVSPDDFDRYRLAPADIPIAGIIAERFNLLDP